MNSLAKVDHIISKKAKHKRNSIIRNKVLSNTKNTKNRQSVKRLNLVLAPLLVYFIIPDFKNGKFGDGI